MIDKKFQPILWEYDISKLNYEDDIVFVRTLKFWNKVHVDILKKRLGKAEFKRKFLKNLENLDLKTVNYWKKVFKIDLTLTHKSTMYEKLNKPIFSRSFR